MYILNQLPPFSPDVVGLDIETDSLDRFGCRIHAIGISDGMNTWILTEQFERIVPLLEDKNCLKIIHNFDFDGTVLAARFNCTLANVWDTLVVERVLNNGRDLDNSLDGTLSRRGIALLDKSVRASFIDYAGDITPEQLAYLEGDVIHLPLLMRSQTGDVNKTGMARVVDLESRTLFPVLQMTLAGVGFALDRFQYVYQEVLEVVAYLQQEMIRQLGDDFFVEVQRTKKGEKYLQKLGVAEINWNSPKQVLPVLHKLKIKLPNTARATLEAVADDQPFIQSMLEYRKWAKMSTWNWDDFLAEHDGRIHPSWNQVGPGTGRFSCDNPNLQQVPRPSKKQFNGKDYPNFRSLFTALPGHVLVVADYAQHEMKILAAISGDPRMIEAANTTDMYAAAAYDVYHKTVTKKDPERQLVKSGMLGIFYGAYPKKLSQTLGISIKDAADFRDLALRTYPVAARWGENQLRFLRTCGYSETALGRKRYFPEIFTTPGDQLWKYSSIARNTPVQGTGADIAKLALCKIYEGLEQGGYDAKIIMAIHDEIVVSSHPDCAAEVDKLVTRSMETAANEICPRVQFVAESQISEVWQH